MTAVAEQTASEIRPFRIQVPEADLEDLRARIVATHWPEKETVSDQSQGPRLATMRALAEYWATEYDWRRCEARMNSFPQFLTEIDGLDIHFLHVRSKHEDALPPIVCHGWPGSIVEQLKIIEPLTDPTAHGGQASDAFHVVVPSMPGYGYSGKPTTTGWGPEHIARAWAELMRRLGYDRYAAQGGDFGALVTPDLGRVDAEHVIGLHVNAATAGFIPFGGVDEAELTEVERARWARQQLFTSDGNAYFQLQATRPQTLAYALTDSPAGQLAWIIEKFKEWTHPVDALPDAVIDRDRLLTNVMLYWLTGTAGSAARIYYENMHSGE